MRDDCGHLSDASERRLLRELLLGVFPSRDVGADGDVLIRLPALVQERDDRRVHPVDVTILGAIAELTVPDVARCDRSPQLPDELLGVIARVDDAVVLAEELFPRIPGNLAERVVDVVDSARRRL